MSVESSPSDEDVVRRVLAGDAEAARLLFDRHLPSLRAAARRRLPAVVRGKLGESDVIQDAYLAAFLHLGEFEDRGDGSFKRWLRTILDRKIANEVRDHVEVGKRDARREVPLAGKNGGNDPALSQTTPSEAAMASEDARAVRASVENLPVDYRTVIDLVHRDGLTLVAAGARMGRTPDAVRKLYARAIALLAVRMRGAGGASA